MGLEPWTSIIDWMYDTQAAAAGGETGLHAFRSSGSSTPLAALGELSKFES